MLKMGRKRKKTSATKSKKKSSNMDLAVIGCFILGILLTILIYAETGSLGQVLSPVLGGIIGVIKYIIPLGMIGISVSLVKNDKEYLISKICQYFVFLSCIAAMMSIFQISKGNLSMDMEFSQVLERAYELGTSNIGGGTVGTVIAYPLISMLGMFGAAVTATGIAIIMLVFTFGLKPAQFILELLDVLEERKEIRNEERDAELEARREERMARMRQHNQEEILSNRRIKEKASKKQKRQKNTEFYTIDDDDTPEIDDEQITINLNNKNAEPLEDSQEDNVFSLFGRKNKPAKVQEIQEEPEIPNPNEIESNLFVQKAEEKEEKVREVLQLEHNADRKSVV